MEQQKQYVGQQQSVRFSPSQLPAGSSSSPLQMIQQLQNQQQQQLAVSLAQYQKVASLQQLNAVLSSPPAQTINRPPSAQLVPNYSNTSSGGSRPGSVAIGDDGTVTVKQEPTTGGALMSVDGFYPSIGSVKLEPKIESKVETKLEDLKMETNADLSTVAEENTDTSVSCLENDDMPGSMSVMEAAKGDEESSFVAPPPKPIAKKGKTEAMFLTL